MAKRDCAAVNVDLLGVPAEALIDRASLCRESLIGFDQVEIVRASTCVFQGFLRRRDRPRTHERGINSNRRPGDDPREWLHATFLGAVSRHQDNRSRAIVDAGGRYQQ